jgi:hypothetical protein
MVVNVTTGGDDAICVGATVTELTDAEATVVAVAGVVGVVALVDALLVVVVVVPPSDSS